MIRKLEKSPNFNAPPVAFGVVLIFVFGFNLESSVICSCFVLFHLADPRGVTHNEVYQGFQHSLTSSDQVVPRVVQTTGSVNPSPTLPNNG